MRTHYRGAVRRYRGRGSVSDPASYMLVIRPACGMKGFGPFRWSDNPTCKCCQDPSRANIIRTNMNRLRDEL